MFLHCLDTTWPPGLHYNEFMATGALGHIHVRLHVAGIQETKECSSYH